MQKRKLNDGSYTRNRPTALTRKTDEYVGDAEDVEDVEDVEDAEEEDEETFLRRHRRGRGK